MRRFLLRLLAFFRADHAEGDLAREIAGHLRLLEDKFISEGMTVEDARYAARRAFGGVEQVKERQRDVRTFRWLTGWSMDLKLGMRMLVRYPGLTLVGGFAIAFAIAIGAAAFEAVTQLVAPALPLDDGGRVVGIRNWDTVARREELRASYDFLTWREELVGIDDLGAFRTLERNLIVGDGGGDPIEVAEITASAFRLARVAPLLGRALLEADERAGAPPVIVIGYDVWQRRFGRDPSIVGQTVRLGTAQTSIVGVMPEGFAFPIAHSLWTPLRLTVAEHGRRQGPEIRVVGRLGSGTSRQEAQAALTAIALRAASAFPETHAHLRPRIVPYASSLLDVDEMLLGGVAINVFMVMFLVLVCANVAALVFARALTRRSEIVLRTALGATRMRIITQLFAESLVLGGAAALLGLAAARLTLEWWMAVFTAEAGGRLPFWLNAGLSATTVMYVGALTVFGALIAGVIPALKVTGRRLESQLRQSAAGASAAGFGGIWTLVIVGQVAVTVAFPATAFFARRHVVSVQSFDVGFPAGRYLSARLEMDADQRPRIQAAYEELERRLSAEVDVAGVTFTDRLPRTTHPARAIELDDDGSAPSGRGSRPRVSRASVGLNFFSVLEAPVLSGRAFTAADVRPGSPVVVVNQSFVLRVLGSRSAVGRHVRYVRTQQDPESPWFEIVGVVPDRGTIYDDPKNAAGIYHPAAPGDARPLHLAVHLRGDPEAFAARLRAIAAAVDPTLRLHEVLPLDKVGATMWMEFDFLWRLLVLVSAIALLLALAGIYSIMSFTVSRRTREIGIRLALGADARRIVTAIFSRALAQVAVGIVAGGSLVFALTQAAAGLTAREVGMVTAYMVVMFGVCILACIVPTRRALRIEPTDILKAEA